MALGVLTRGSLAGLLNAVALRFADRTAVVDELGAISYADLDRDANAIANGWLDRGLRAAAARRRRSRWRRPAGARRRVRRAPRRRGPGARAVARLDRATRTGLAR